MKKFGRFVRDWSSFLFVMFFSLIFNGPRFVKELFAEDGHYDAAKSGSFDPDSFPPEVLEEV